MRAVTRPALSFFLALCWSSGAWGVERVVWQLGQQDGSVHEFQPYRFAPGQGAPGVTLDVGAAAKGWPGFHPGSGNGNLGGVPHPFTLIFHLPEAPKGVFYLNLDLLFRQPRVPTLRIEINGHSGNFYFHPRLRTTLGDEDEAFNPICSFEARRIALPARYFRAGENRLTLTCLDEPATVTNHITVGGPGDSGLYYDALSLTHDAEAVEGRKLSVALEPTVLYRNTPGGLAEDCWLTVRYPDTWRGGRARVTRGAFRTEIEVSKAAEFGEARFRIQIPDGTPAGATQIEISDKAGRNRQTFTADFTPRRKWKLFYAPHMHLDIGFTDYQAKVAEVWARQIDKLVDVSAAQPDYRFNIDGSWILEQWLATRRADVAQKLAAQARAGRIGVDAFYASYLTQALSLEEHYRGLYLSKRLESEYGLPFDAAYITDVPSYSWAIPSTLAASGIRFLAGGGNQTRGPLLVHGQWHRQSPFWWEGPDGARVLAWYSNHYHQLRAVFGVPPTLAAGASGLALFLQTFERNDYAPDAVLMYGTEVENVPLDFEDATLAARWNAHYAYPRIVNCRFADFFRYVEERFGEKFPVVRGDSGAYWEDGVGTMAASTGVYRASQSRALAADALSALTASLGGALRFPGELSRRIWDNLLVYGEHTIVSYRGPRQPEHDEMAEQLKVKQARAIDAAKNIDELMRRAMSQLADRIATRGENLVVFNPLSWRRSGLVRFQVEAGTVLTDVSTNTVVPLEVIEERDGYQTVRFRAQDVPSLGYKVYRLSPGPTALPGRSEPESNVFQNQFYRVTIDPTRGAIRSLYDRELGRELVDSASPYLLNEYLYVSGGGSEAGRGEMGEGGDATQLTHLARHLPYAELTVQRAEQGQIEAVQKTPWGHVVRLSARGMNTPEIETEIDMPDDEKRIEFRNRIRKDLTYAKEAVYFAFPWAAQNPAFRFDSAVGWIDPERDLLLGGCNEWFAPQNWVNVEDAGAAMTLAIVDAPLVSLGDINRGRWPARFEKSSATVFSYALNNYWFTNTPAGQSGEFVFRYAITSGSRFDPQAAARFAREARTPLEVSHLRGFDKFLDREPAPGSLPAGGASLVEIAPANVVVSALKGAEDGDGIVLRVQEVAGRAADGRITLPLISIASAYEANGVEVPGKNLEADDHSVRFSIKPHQVLTIRLKP
jgi:alpha-mannosidase